MTQASPGESGQGLPPQSGPVTADTPLSAIAAIGGAGWRDDGRDTLSVPRPRPAGHRGSRGAGAPSRTRSVARPRAWPSDNSDGRPRSTPGSTSRPTTASASPGRSSRPPSSGTGSAPPPPARGRRRMADAPVRPPLAREAWSTGAEVAGAPWQTHRPPPRELGPDASSSQASEPAERPGVRAAGVRGERGLGQGSCVEHLDNRDRRVLPGTAHRYRRTAAVIPRCCGRSAWRTRRPPPRTGPLPSSLEHARELVEPPRRLSGGGHLDEVVDPEAVGLARTRKWRRARWPRLREWCRRRSRPAPRRRFPFRTSGPARGATSPAGRPAFL